MKKRSSPSSAPPARSRPPTRRDLLRMDRKATCGACGSERVVDDFMRRTPDMQFRARPTEPTDEFYCHCQDDDDGSYGDNPGQGYD
jgi:hypothetical protein